MKKSLLAVAAIGAFASAAQAQSSVTVYGILDVGYVGGNAKATTVNATGGQVTPSESVSLLGQSAQTSSRLGFKGTEDLGGGLSALFTLETGLNPNASSLSSFNNRQAFIGLAKKGLGQAAIGTQYTPIHNAVAATGANQQNNLVGDVIYPQNTGLTNRDGSSSNANAGYTVRSSNMLRLDTESFAGFKAAGFVVANARNENQTSYPASAGATSGTTSYTNGTGYTGGNTNSTGWGLGVNYTWQKLLVSLNYQSFKTENSWTEQTTLVATGGTAAAAAATTRSSAAQTGQLTNINDNQMYAGATYDFGILKAYAQYVNRKETSGLSSNYYAKRTAQQIGVRSFVTPTVEVWASGGMGRYAAFGASNPTVNFTGYQLGANYWLSKRTNLYTIFGATNTSTGAANVALSNGTDSGVKNFSANSNNYGVGVRHTF
jgi:predicted porin